MAGGWWVCSVLYHLTKLGWKDVVLVEKDELTSGSTWHAAGGMHTSIAIPTSAKLQKYTIELYSEIEEVSGQSCGVHLTGGVMLAGTKERMDWLKATHAKGRYLGMDTEIISADEAAKRFPLMDKKHFVGAVYDANEGHVDPSGVTNAYAKAARIGGAEVYRHTQVTAVEQRQDGTWDVITEKGNIHTEHLVNAGGLWSRGSWSHGRPGAPGSCNVSSVSDHRGYARGDGATKVRCCMRSTSKARFTCVRNATACWSGLMRKEGCPGRSRWPPGTSRPPLLPPDIDRIASRLEVGFSHFPPIERAGIKQIIHGPFTFAPDGNPLMGPVRGLKNYWVACAVMAGFSQGGGVGLALSNWMVNGDPGFDVWAMDVARFGDYTNLAYTNAKVRENYARRFQIVFPNEELPAARDLRMTPAHERLKEHNAVFGVGFGLETALWFAPEGTDPVEEVTFRRSNAFESVAEECRAVREAVGLIEIAGFAKYEITGPEAEVWLSHLLANKMPRKGRMVLCPMLNPAGKLIGDFTVAKHSNERFYIFGSGPAEEYHMRWFEQHLPESGVAVRALGGDLVGFSIAGPKSNELLDRLTHDDVSTKAFRFMAIRDMHVGMIPAMVARITFTGDLGYEIWVKNDYQLALHDLLWETGKDLGIRHFGSRALDSLRLEKSFGNWAREFRPIYGPFEADMGRFVDLSKNDFIGRDAALAEKEEGPKQIRVTLVIDHDDIDVIGDEPVWHDGKVVGWVTSGAYAHYVDKSVALAYIPTELSQDANGSFEVEVLGERRPAVLAPEPLFDPKAERMRM